MTQSIKHSKNRTDRKTQRGMSLFELLVVLTIMALLATLVAPRVVGYLGRAKADVARSQLSNLSTAMELFFLDYGRYPTPEEGLGALVAAPAGSAEMWRGPYFKDQSGLDDPWGRPFQLTVNADAETFEIVSLGRDGEEGGDDDDADIRAN
ncbi:MAG: type II secretion system major pseudopilin GspG [Pseudomonadota bacterium]